MRSFSDKSPAEAVVCSVDFKKLMPTGTTIVSTIVSIAPHSPADADLAGMLAVSAQVSGTVVKQKIAGGDEDATYWITFRVTLSDAQIVEETVAITIARTVST